MTYIEVFLMAVAIAITFFVLSFWLPKLFLSIFTSFFPVRKYRLKKFR